MKNKSIKLELLEVPESFYGYSVKTSEGSTLSSNRRFKHYRGVIADDPRSIAAISFVDNEIMGIIATDEGNFNLVLDPKLGRHLLYNENNLVKKLDFVCGTIKADSKPYEPEVLSQKSKLSARSSTKCIRLYFETEQDIFTTRGSVASVEGFVSGLFNQVSTLYQNEGIQTEISEIFVWTTADPYNANTTAGLLGEFQATRTVFNGALGQLLTFRSAVGGGRAAGFDGLCNSNTAQRLSVSMIYNTYSSVPTYSWSTYVVTHEFGHLFGSRHTHACVWNGNNTAIDGCAGETEPAIAGGATCPVPGNPAGGGTIMSYCHLQGVGINFNLGFGMQPGNVIRNSVNNGTCVCSCPSISGSNLVCSSSTYSVSNLGSGNTITWSSSNTSVLAINSSSGFVTRMGNGQVTVTASMNTGCGNATLTKTIWVGEPGFFDISGPETICTNNLYQYNLTANNPLDQASYSWSSSSPNLSLSGSGFSVNASSGIAGTYLINVTAQNACGTSSNSLGIDAIFCSVNYTVYPNPARDYLTIEFDNTDNLTALPETISLMSEASTIAVRVAKIKDLFDQKAFKDGTKVVFDVRELPRGIYYLHIADSRKEGQQVESIRILLD